MTDDASEERSDPETDAPSEQASINIGTLPTRTDDRGPEAVGTLNGDEGDRCVRDCDCADGLVCRVGTCTSDW